MARVMLVDDDAMLVETLGLGLRQRGHAVTTTTSLDGAVRALMTADFDVVVTDVAMRGGGGMELCSRIVADRADLPVILMTAFGSMDAAVEAIRAGAYDFIGKPVALEALELAVERAARHRRLDEEVRRLRRMNEVPKLADGLVMQSAVMLEMLEVVERVALTDATVLVTGESGTGKEVVARMLHARSARRDEAFVAVSCAAMPAALLESELFGYARGAFTDARSPRRGLFDEADRGTLFLDEIGELPLALQPKLLRVLQERTVRPLGTSSEHRIDVRLVAATNRDLEAAIEDGRFREDLYYRLNVVHIPLPPLRARGGDVLPLAQAFVADLSRRQDGSVRALSRGAAERLLAYPWPGNVRELRNCIERAVALARFDVVTVEDLPEKVRDYRQSHVVVAADDPSDLVPLEEVERRYIHRVMQTVNGNKSAAARILGLDRKRLYRMLERLGLQP